MITDTPQRSSIGTPAAIAGVVQVESEWETPGLWLAKRACMLRGVRLVSEKHDTGKFLIFIVLSEDHEPTLDQIFDAEREMFGVFRQLPFDLRVISIGGACDLDGIASTSLVHFLQV